MVAGAILVALHAIQLNVHGDPPRLEGEVDYSNVPTLIPEGLYEARFLYHETARVFNSAKIFLWFEITQPGEYLGKRLYLPYRLHCMVGKPGRSGRFKVRTRSELFWMLWRVTEVKRRPDRLSTTDLKGVVLEIRVRTVLRDYKQRELPEALRYSVVDDVVRKLTG